MALGAICLTLKGIKMVDYEMMDWPECRECGEEFHPAARSLAITFVLSAEMQRRKKPLLTNVSALLLSSTRVATSMSVVKKQLDGQAGNGIRWG